MYNTTTEESVTSDHDEYSPLYTNASYYACYKKRGRKRAEEP